MIMDIYGKLDPKRFPNMSLLMTAILGFVLEREYTKPTLADVQVTPDGHVLARQAEQAAIGHSMHLGAAADLRANFSRLAIAAGLDQGDGLSSRRWSAPGSGWSWWISRARTVPE